MAGETINNNRGFGTWSLAVYNPPQVITEKGYLIINKDYHTIFSDINISKTLLSVPSQNVAWVQLIQKNDI